VAGAEKSRGDFRRGPRVEDAIARRLVRTPQNNRRYDRRPCLCHLFFFLLGGSSRISPSRSSVAVQNAVCLSIHEDASRIAFGESLQRCSRPTTSRLSSPHSSSTR